MKLHTTCMENVNCHTRPCMKVTNLSVPERCGEIYVAIHKDLSWFFREFYYMLYTIHSQCPSRRFWKPSPLFSLKY